MNDWIYPLPSTYGLERLTWAGVNEGRLTEDQRSLTNMLMLPPSEKKNSQPFFFPFLWLKTFWP